MNLTPSETTLLVSFIGMVGLVVGYVLTFRSQSKGAAVQRAAALDNREAEFQKRLWESNQALEKQVKDQQTEIEGLENGAREKDRQIGALTGQVNSLASQMLDLQKEKAALEARVHAQDLLITELRGQLVELARRVPSAGAGASSAAKEIGG